MSAGIRVRSSARVPDLPKPHVVIPVTNWAHNLHPKKPHKKRAAAQGKSFLPKCSSRVSATAFLLIPLVSSQLNCHRTSVPQFGVKLNILFIVVDDLSVSLGCYGNKIVKTPNIDRLAHKGIVFRNAYCQYSLCNPSRTSFLSGRRPETTGVWHNMTSPRTYLKDVVFLPEYFRQAGYFTAGIGKIVHDGFENEVTWDVSENLRQFRTGFDHWDELSDETIGIPWLAVKDPDELEPDGRIALRVVEILNQNKDKLFFVGVGFRKPHRPYIAPKRYFDLYGASGTVAPPNAWSDERKVAWLRNQDIKHYYACVSFIDAQIGILVDALQRLDLMKKTIIVLLGDNGFHLGEHGGLWRKQTLWEEALHVPLIIAAPDQKRGAESSRLVELVDLYPSLAELCRLRVPDGMEGTSLLPLLQDPNRAWKKAVFSVQEKNGVLGVSVRSANYHYIQWGFNTSHLFDLRVDQSEESDLSDDLSYGAVKAQMRALLQGWWKGALPEGDTREGYRFPTQTRSATLR